LVWRLCAKSTRYQPVVRRPKGQSFDGLVLESFDDRRLCGGWLACQDLAWHFRKGRSMSDASAKVLGRTPTRRTRRMSVIWAIPVLAIAIGAWLAWDTLSKQGPRIVVSFQDAEGLQVGQSQLKFKDITLGTVKSLDFTPDHRNVLVTIATTKQAEPMLTSGTQFWVVKPRLFAGNLSGFSTLLSGAYIGMLPDDGSSKPARDFVGREEPPVLESEVPGKTFLLKAEQLGSVNLGSPLFFRGLDVGEVLGWDIGDMATNVTIHAFVRAPFDGYVHEETRFWNASGVSVKLGGGGVDVQVESLRAVLLGGIAFDTPAAGQESQLSVANHVFPLFANEDAAKSASYTRQVALLSYFSGSVRGLAVGSDVVMHGLKVGRVTDVRLAFDPVKNTITAPVRFEVQPERIIGIGHKAIYTPAEAVQQLVDQGVRASLESGNLLTGEMLIGLDIVPNAPPAGPVTMDDGAFVLPSSDAGSLGGLQASAGELLRNVNAIPFASIGQSAKDVMKSMDQLANGPQLKEALTSMAATMVEAHQLLQTVNSDAGPALKRLPELTTSLQATLKQSNQLMLSAQAGYGDNSQLHRELDRLMLQLNDALRSIAGLADLLVQHPEALVRGRTDTGGK
jgi:paraquat-inducible protein B